MERPDPKQSVIVVVDVQEKLAAAMPDEARASLLRSAGVLLEAADALSIKVLATEQYPQGLGLTVAVVSERLGALSAPVIPKLAFSACGDPAFRNAFNAMGCKAAVVIGMEAHVCVFQTVRDLAAMGCSVHVPIDGVASRRDDHRQTGLALCKEAGATLTTTETIVFDWLERAGTNAFKRLSKAIR